MEGGVEKVDYGELPLIDDGIEYDNDVGGVGP